MLGMANINIHRTLVSKCRDEPSFGRMKWILASAINKGVKGIETVVDKTQPYKCLTLGCSSFGSCYTIPHMVDTRIYKIFNCHSKSFNTYFLGHKIRNKSWISVYSIFNNKILEFSPMFLECILF
jgi:hypothetical protein